MNAKALIPLVAGLGIAGLAAKLGLDFIRKAEGKQTQMVSLWAPIEDVQRGVAIDEAMLRPIAFPLDAVPAGALADLEQIRGRVPHTGAPAGLPVLESMLLPPGVRPGVRVPPGLRAVAVKIDESSGVDNHLEPGCRVDVVGVFTVRRGNRAETIAKTILENVEVAAVGQRLAPSAPTAGDDEGKAGRRERPARAVTLLVKPGEVPTLHLAEQKGKIKLSMRGTLDEGRDRLSRAVAEGDLTGETKPQPTEAAPSFGEKFNEFVSSFWKGSESEPEPEPEPATVSEPEPVVTESGPRLAWTMMIYNGDERRTLGWTKLSDFRPIELSPSEGPNIFEDGPKLPPQKTKTESRPESQTGGQAPPPPTTTEPDPPADGGSLTEVDTESEPKELFE